MGGKCSSGYRVNSAPNTQAADSKLLAVLGIKQQKLKDDGDFRSKTPKEFLTGKETK